MTGRPKGKTMASLVGPDIFALRHRGLGYRAIAEAIDHFKGIPLTENQVQLYLRQSGAVPRKNMVRAHLPEATA